MAIVRKYETKAECVGLFMDEMFDYVDSTLITENAGWRENWEFVSTWDEEEHDEDEEPFWFDEDEGLVYYESPYSYDGGPAWLTWFEFSDGFMRDRAERLRKEIAEDCGFILIYHDGELWGLGVDGAGYSFRDTHFTRLYDLLGFKWHK